MATMTPRSGRDLHTPRQRSREPSTARRSVSAKGLVLRTLVHTFNSHFSTGMRERISLRRWTMTAAEADRHIRAIEEALTKVSDTDPRAPVVKAIGQAVSALLS